MNGLRARIKCGMQNAKSIKQDCMHEVMRVMHVRRSCSRHHLLETTLNRKLRVKCSCVEHDVLVRGPVLRPSGTVGRRVICAEGCPQTDQIAAQRTFPGGDKACIIMKDKRQLAAVAAQHALVRCCYFRSVNEVVEINRLGCKARGQPASAAAGGTSETDVAVDHFKSVPWCGVRR